MPSPETLLAFAAATLVFAYMPGPALLYTAAQTMARGRRAGLMAALGIHVGCYVHVVAAAAGLSVLFSAVPALYVLLKIAGAIYLAYLGLRLIIDRGSAPEDAGGVEAKTGRRAFVESIAVEVLNPKVAIFFIAFLPHFVEPGLALPVWAQFLILGTIVNLTFTSADLMCVVLAGAVVDRLRRSPRAARLTRRMGGGLLMGLGAHLVLQRS
ncbi:MAG: LysE family translocator [Pseudomonadota bacterium]